MSVSLSQFWSRNQLARSIALTECTILRQCREIVR